MKLLHRLNVDDRMEPARGLFLEYSEGKLARISLVWWIAGRRSRLQFVDYRSGVVDAPTRYWVRASYMVVKWHGFRSHWDFCWGSNVHLAEGIELVKVRSLALFEQRGA